MFSTNNLSRNVTDIYLSEIWKYYLENDSKTKADGTVRKYKSLWKIHVKKQFGEKLISEITISDLYNYLCDLYSEGYSYTYVESFLKMFYMLFGIAYRLEKISTDRYTRMFLDKGTKLTMPPLSQDDYEEMEDIKIYNSSEIHKIEEVFHDGNCYLPFLLGYYCGLRISEVFGLTWDDYDWRTHQLKINKQMVYNYTDKCFTLTPVKTLTSVRLVDVPDFLHNYLLNRIKEETDIDFKFHSLRKTHISILASMNTPIIEVMKRVGHKKYSTTMKYYV